MPSSTPRAANPARILARVVVPAAILIGAAVVIGITSIRAFEHAPQVGVTPVAVVASQTAAIPAESGIQAAGWIEPAPFAVEIRALREGIVEEVRVLEGATVAAGEVLATLESAQQQLAIARAAAELRVAEADVEARAARAGAAETLFERATEPERRIQVAEATLAEASAMAARLEAEIEEARLAAREARDEFERKSSLAESGAFSPGEARRLGLRADALAARLKAVELERPAREARRAVAEAECRAARTARESLIAERATRDEARAELAHAAATRDLQAAVLAEATLALARSEIRATRAGVILTRTAVPGSRTGGEEPPLFTLYDPAELQVRCDVPIKDAARLAVGLAAEIRSDALPNTMFAGTVVRIVPQGDIQKNTVQCKVRIDRPDPALRPDMLVRVRIAPSAADGKSSAEAIAVPLDALRARAADGAEAEVLVAIPEGALARTELRRIALGAPREGGWIEVRDGLAAGDRVVLDAGIAPDTRIDPVEHLKGDAP
jgi:HlyD family secretion protein